MSKNKAMNKIEQILSENHGLYTLYSVKNKNGECESVISVKSAAEVTEQIAIEFWAWMRENDTPDNAEQYGNYTDKDMFQEFLKTKQ